ncbi:MAG: thiamine phosphate synthase [Rhizobacter sp.]|nr:thiamine phosphate synthase [Rhizobacter sp.]
MDESESATPGRTVGAASASASALAFDTDQRPSPVQTRALLRLYLVTDSALCLGRDLMDVVAEAAAAGVTCVQLREKQLGTQAFTALAVRLRALLRPLRIPLVINDRIDVALACDADGVHLGQTDTPVEVARRLLPDHVVIGLSVETVSQVVTAMRAPAATRADYLGISPIYATPTKLDAGLPWGLHGLRDVRALTDMPLVAIGGIHEPQVRDVLAAGADGIAVVSAICSAPDVAAATRRLAALTRGD